MSWIESGGAQARKRTKFYWTNSSARTEREASSDTRWPSVPIEA